MPDPLSPDVERELAALDNALAGRPVAPDLAELGELARLVRDDRAEPSGAFGATLDAEVKRGFSQGDPRRRASGPRWRKGWGTWLTPALGATAAVLLIVIVAVTGSPTGGDEASTSAGGDQSASSAAGQESGAAAPEPGRSPGEGATAAQDDAASFAEPLPPGSVPPAPAPGSPRSDGRVRRAVERSASLTLAVRPRDMDAVSARVQEVTRRLGGFVAASTVDSSAGGGSGTFELRIPTRELDAAMAALARLGQVRERAQRARDITAQAVSARSLVSDARTERESLLEQLGEADTVRETESIRARLRFVSREIERARAGVRRVRNRAAFSTVGVTLVAEHGGGAEEEDGTWTPGDAAGDALRLLEVAAGVALVALALALPLSLLALAAALAMRWMRRRRRDHALEAV